MNRSLIWIMSVSCGVCVANLYYMQPLLADMADTFQTTQVAMGTVAMIAQVGYGLGLIFILPIGDIRERKKLILIMLILSVIALGGIVLSFNLTMLSVSCFALGLATVVPQLFITLASKLASPEQRGKIIGTLLSGLLIGILVSRTFSGFLGDYYGWRLVYGIAAAVMGLLIIVISKCLPICEPGANLQYKDLLQSMIHFIKTEPVLRKASIMGAMMFGAFMAFWTSLIFLLESPHFNMGAKEAGLFGLVGITGALAAPVVGKMADKRGTDFVIRLSIFFVFLSFTVLTVFGYSIPGLIIGVILLDLGHQSCNVCNQTRVQSLHAEARSRLNSVYIASSFIGAAIGSFMGAFCFSHFGWMGVCAYGFATQIIAAAVHMKKVNAVNEQAV